MKKAIPGRNDPCPCGSGRKYKRCCLPLQGDHLDPEDAQRLQSLKKLLKRADSGRCMYPTVAGECGAPSIRSHSVARAAHLSRIAVDGHVRGYRPDLFKPLFTAERIGIQAASTFPGFCSNHDDLLFQPIDRPDLVVDARTATLLGYRAFTRELHSKRAALSTLREMGVPMQFDSPHELHELGGRDMESEKPIWDALILGQPSHRDLRHAVLRTATVPEIVGSVYICPGVDFLGAPLQDVTSEAPADYISASIIPQGDQGAVVFAWLASHQQVGERLIESLAAMKPDSRGDAIVRFFFANAENLYWSPAWWDTLGDADRRQVEMLMPVEITGAALPKPGPPLVSWSTDGLKRSW